MKRFLPFIIIILVLGVTIGSVVYMKQASSSPSRPAGVVTPASPTNTNTAASAETTNLPPGATPPWVLGPANARVVLEEFGDFECPPCGILHPILLQMHKEFPDQLQIIFREFPLTPNHRHALNAAYASEAAGIQGKFWEMHDLIYETQKSWHEAFSSKPIFEDYAKRIGLDVERFKQDVESDHVARRVTADGVRGRAMGVKGTPTVFLNGREVPFESLPADKLRELIKAALAASTK